MSASVHEMPRKGRRLGQYGNDTLQEVAQSPNMPRKRRGGGQATTVTHDFVASSATIAGHNVSETHGAVASGDADQVLCATQSQPVSIAPKVGRKRRSASDGGQFFAETPIGVVSVAPIDGQRAVAAQPRAAVTDSGLALTIGLLTTLHREYRGLQLARGNLDRTIAASTRWRACQRVGVTPTGKGFKFPKTTKADEKAVAAVYPRWFVARKAADAVAKDCLADMLEQTKRLPCQDFVTETKGFQHPSYAAIIANAGDLRNYKNPGKLWKRFSLHVVGDRASRRVKGDASQGFVPKRRAEMHVIGDCLLRARGAYAELYRTRKAREVEKAHELGLQVRPAARIPKKNAEKFISEGLIHKRALRYIEKRLLRELWKAWREIGPETVRREAKVLEQTKAHLPPAHSDAPKTKRRQETRKRMEPSEGLSPAPIDASAKGRRRRATRAVEPKNSLPSAPTEAAKPRRKGPLEQ